MIYESMFLAPHHSDHCDSINMTFKELIDKARSSHLDEILSTYGVAGVKEGSSVRYKNEAMNLVVTGDKWYDNEAGVGSIGPIDLVSHLQGCSFREAVLWIVKSSNPTSAVLPASNFSAKMKNEIQSLSYEEAREQYAPRDDSRWKEARSYLIDQRCLNGPIVDELFKRGNIYATKKGGIAFLHRNLEGVEVGSSIRAIQHDSAFRQSIGTKTEGWFSLGNLKDAKTIVVAESAIDALSFATLYPLEPETAVTGISGAYSPLPLLRHAWKNRAKIVAAYDNDAVGLKAKDQLRIDWEKISRSNGEFEEKISALKDWNEDLCRSYQQKNQKWTICSDGVESSVSIPK